MVEVEEIANKLILCTVVAARDAALRHRLGGVRHQSVDELVLNQFWANKEEFWIEEKLKQNDGLQLDETFVI